MNSTEEDYAIVAFGNIDGRDRTLSADDVFKSLFDSGLWYVTRRSNAIHPGTRVLFYQSGKGFRGTAVVRDVVEDSTDRLLGTQIMGRFSHRLLLSECRPFENWVDIREMLARLEFVTNKTYWGQAFRTTPRRISEADFMAIMAKAKVRGAKTDA